MRRIITSPDHHPQAAKPESGQGLVEYALILAMVAMAVVVMLSMFGPQIGNIYSNIVTILLNEDPVTWDDLQFATDSCVTNNGAYNSLSNKISSRDLSGIIQQVNEQSGKQIDTSCADWLLSVANEL